VFRRIRPSWVGSTPFNRNKVNVPLSRLLTIHSIYFIPAPAIAFFFCQGFLHPSFSFLLSCRAPLFNHPCLCQSWSAINPPTLSFDSIHLSFLTGDVYDPRAQVDLYLFVFSPFFASLLLAIHFPQIRVSSLFAPLLFRCDRTVVHFRFQYSPSRVGKA